MRQWKRKLENGFESFARYIYNRPRRVIALWLLATALLGSQISRLEMDVSIEGFFRKDDPTYIDYNAFRDQFGREDLSIILLNPKQVFDLDFLRQLEAFHENLEREVPHLKDVSSLINVRSTRGEGDRLIVEDLMRELPTTPAALASLRERVMSTPLYVNNLISEDARFTAVVLRTVTYSEIGMDEQDVMAGFDELEESSLVDQGDHRKFLTVKEQKEMVDAARKVIARYKSADFPIHFGGSNVINDTLNDAVHKDMFIFAWLALAIIGGLLFLLFRRLTGVALPLFVVVTSLFTTLALMARGGIALEMSASFLPAFLLAVGVGDAVHLLTLFYRRLDETLDREGAVVYAVGHSGVPILMTSLTTAAGLASFIPARIATVSEIGIYASIGVMVAFAYTLLLLPAFLALIPVRPRTLSGANKRPVLDRLLLAVGDFAINRSWSVVTTVAILVVFALSGTTRLSFSQNSITWFAKDAPVRLDTERIDGEMKGSMTIELVVDTGKENGLYEPAVQKNLEKLSEYAMQYRNADGKTFVGQTQSVMDILKETNKALNGNRPEAYVLPESRELIAQELLLFENSGSDDLLDVVDSRFSKARFTARVPQDDATAYLAFVDDMGSKARELFGNEAKITTTGLLTLLSQSLVAMISSMKTSYTIAVFVIAIMMVLFLGSLRYGLFSMVPNLFPIVLTMGLMGWLGIPLDSFTILVGTIALGLAVDDTIHFMHNFRRYYGETQDVRTAVRETMLTTGRAMLYTTLVLVGGFWIYMAGTLKLLFNFGLLTGITILLALLADILLVPAIMNLAMRRKLPFQKVEAGLRRSSEVNKTVLTTTHNA